MRPSSSHGSRSMVLLAAQNVHSVVTMSRSVKDFYAVQREDFLELIRLPTILYGRANTPALLG